MNSRLYIRSYRKLTLSSRLAPLDLPLPNSKTQFLDLFRVLNIPSAFSNERVNSVSHSFGTIADAEGTCTWFHFLCKNITVSNNNETPGVTYFPGADHFARRHPTNHSVLQATLPQADYSYIKSGFCLRTTVDGGTTLVCFGATPPVEARLRTLTTRSAACRDAIVEPYILIDTILDGLYHDVDRNVWNMNKIFGAFEHVSMVLTRRREGFGVFWRKLMKTVHPYSFSLTRWTQYWKEDALCRVAQHCKAYYTLERGG